LNKYRLVLPEYFDAQAGEIEAKGYFADAVIESGGRTYRPHFMDPPRLTQEITEELRRQVVYLEPNLVIVRSITRQTLDAAAAVLAASGFSGLMHDVASETG
jgi:hypothetical protein